MSKNNPFIYNEEENTPAPGMSDCMEQLPKMEDPAQEEQLTEKNTTPDILYVPP